MGLPQDEASVKGQLLALDSNVQADADKAVISAALNDMLIYTQTDEFREFFSNFLSYTTQQKLKVIFLAPDSFSLRYFHFVGAFAFHLARTFSERVLIVESDSMYFDEREDLAKVIGFHAGTRSSAVGEVDFLPKEHLPDSKIEPGLQQKELKRLFESFQTVICLGTADVSSQLSHLYYDLSDFSLLLSSSTSLARGMTKKRLNEFNRRKIDFDACVVLTPNSTNYQTINHRGEQWQR